MAKSIISNERECYICHTQRDLQRHHIFGGPNRRRSDDDGLWIYLCVDHHTGNHGVHRDFGLALEIKQMGERAWIERYGKTREEFIRDYGKNFL